MRHQLRDLFITATIVTSACAWTGVNAEEAALFDANADGRVSFLESREAFESECCALETADLINTVADDLTERHSARVEVWTDLRAGPFLIVPRLLVGQ